MLPYATARLYIGGLAGGGLGAGYGEPFSSFAGLACACATPAAPTAATTPLVKSPRRDFSTMTFPYFRESLAGQSFRLNSTGTTASRVRVGKSAGRAGSGWAR